jgi:hypothetical protein
MDRPRRRPSELSAKELNERAVEYRRMALIARGEATVRSLNALAARYAMLAAKREVEASTNTSSDPTKSEVQDLIAWAEQASANVANPFRALAKTIKMMADSEADPYLTMGVLIEGAVHTLITCIPATRQAETALAMVKLMADRLQTNLPPPT